jgi:hypothetical protein
LQYAEALAISDFQNEIMQVVKMQHSWNGGTYATSRTKNYWCGLVIKRQAESLLFYLQMLNVYNVKKLNGVFLTSFLK